MIQNLILVCFIQLAFQWSISQQDACSCEHTYIEEYCNSDQCEWQSSTSTCQEYPCSGWNDASGCFNLYNRCYWNSTACVQFTSCSNLFGDSQKNCSHQNPTCSYKSGDHCVQQSCSIYNNQTCPSVCYNSTKGCVEYSSCSQLNSTQCSKIPDICHYSNDSCSPATCETAYADTESCYFIYQDFSKQVITPCYKEGKNCKDAEPKNLKSPFECEVSTNNYWHWSSSSESNGNCVSCFQMIINCVIMIILMII